MGVFSRKNSPEHDAGVMYVYDKSANDIAYYSAACKCGWYVDPVDSAYPNREVEQRIVALALAHFPGAETSVGFPINDPPVSD